MHFREAFKQTVKRLEAHQCTGANPKREAMELITFVTGNSEVDLLTANPELNPSQTSELSSLTERRLNHEPLEHILGSAVFLGKKIVVSGNVLIPRPATEIMVSHAIEEWRNAPVTVIDAGTGSGCAAVSFALELPKAKIIATDSSKEALKIAKHNAVFHEVEERIHFGSGDLLLPILKMKGEMPAARKKSLIIFANLPYIPSDEIDKLDPDVRNYEPIQALDGGADGLHVYERLVRQLSELIEKNNGNQVQLYLEALPDQLRRLTEIIAGQFQAVQTSYIYADSEGKNPVGLTSIINND